MCFSRLVSSFTIRYNSQKWVIPPYGRGRSPEHTFCYAVQMPYLRSLWMYVFYHILLKISSVGTILGTTGQTMSYVMLREQGFDDLALFCFCYLFYCRLFCRKNVCFENIRPILCFPLFFLGRYDIIGFNEDTHKPQHTGGTALWHIKMNSAVSTL